jgi:hypothetical protein
MQRSSMMLMKEDVVDDDNCLAYDVDGYDDGYDDDDGDNDDDGGGGGDDDDDDDDCIISISQVAVRYTNITIIQHDLPYPSVSSVTHKLS